MEPTIAPIVSAIYSFNAVPSTVIASASNVPSISALPDTSNVVKSNSPAMVTLPSAKVIKSVSEVCPIVVPLTITLSTVKVVSVPRLVIFACAAVFNVPAKSVEVNKPLEGLYVKPVSLSAPWLPVAPSTKIG